MGYAVCTGFIVVIWYNRISYSILEGGYMGFVVVMSAEKNFFQKIGGREHVSFYTLYRVGC